MQNTIQASRSWPRRSRVAGPRARSRARTAHRDLKEPYEHVRDPRSGVVMLRDVRDWIAAAQGACSRRMAIARLAHEALYAEHSRQASEAAVKLEGIDREVEQLGPSTTTDAAHRGVIRDLHAAQRELAKLDEHMPATPPSPRPTAFDFEAPTIHVEPTNAQRGGTSPRRARIAQTRARVKRAHPRSRAAFNVACSTSTACLEAAVARSAVRGAKYDAIAAQVAQTSFGEHVVSAG